MKRLTTPRLIATCAGWIGRPILGLARNRAGAVAAMLAISLPVMLVAIGAGTNFTQASQARAALQDAVNAVAIGAVVSYASTGNASSTVGSYETGAAAMLPSTVKNISWGTPTYTPASTSTAKYTVTVSATAVVKAPLFASLLPTVNISATATATDPAPPSVQQTYGNCVVGGNDLNAVYVYTVPRGITGNYAVSPGNLTSSQLLYYTSNGTACNPTSFVPPAATSIIGFAYQDVTGFVPNGSELSECDTDYFTNSDSSKGKNPDYGQKTNNDQYGNLCQSSNWRFSTSWPPDAVQNQWSGYKHCGTTYPCQGTDGTGIYALYAYGNGNNTPTTDEALQIYIATTDASQASGTLQEPSSNATVYWNFSSLSTQSGAPLGACILYDSAGNNYCKPFTASSAQATTIKTYGALDCTKYPGKTFMFFWNDMGGFPDDMNYGNLDYYYKCGGTTNTGTTSASGKYAYLSQ